MEDSTDENEICIKHPVEQEKFEIQSKINENQSSSLSSQTKFKAYVSRALSSWGNRIWAFSFGVFINKLAPDNLRTGNLWICSERVFDCLWSKYWKMD